MTAELSTHDDDRAEWLFENIPADVRDDPARRSALYTTDGENSIICASCAIESLDNFIPHFRPIHPLRVNDVPDERCEACSMEITVGDPHDDLTYS